MMVHDSDPRWRQEDREFKARQGKVIMILSQRHNKSKRAGGIAKVAEHLLAYESSWVQSLILQKKLMIGGRKE
jgi:hypothetical protein